MIKAYLAGGIFTLGDELRNKYFAEKLRKAFPDMDLYSPIENTEINGIEGKKKFAGSKEIADGDNNRLDNTDILIACIDGDVLPSGTCAEIGVMREKIRRGDHKYIIGICTDNRECSRTHSEAKDIGAASGMCEEQYSYQNLYVVGCIKQSGILVNNIDDAINFIKSVENEFIKVEKDEKHENASASPKIKKVNLITEEEKPISKKKKVVGVQTSSIWNLDDFELRLIYNLEDGTIIKKIFDKKSFLDYMDTNKILDIGDYYDE